MDAVFLTLFIPCHDRAVVDAGFTAGIAQRGEFDGQSRGKLAAIPAKLTGQNTEYDRMKP